MSVKSMKRIILIFICIVMIALTFSAQAQSEKSEPIRKTITFSDSLREYYVRLPKNFAPKKTYWALVGVHGGGGNGLDFFMAENIRQMADSVGLNVIVITPSFSNTDFLASRFPDLGEGKFLKAILGDIQNTYKIREKILLVGYSRGGQFTHRFAMQNPERIAAVAPLASGTWTTPQGKLLIDSFGEVENPNLFLSNPNNKSMVPERLRNMFSQRVANVAGLIAKPGAKNIPFLVMCGTLDPRLDIAKKFVQSLKDNGFHVEDGWPKTPHYSQKEEFQAEFKIYSQTVVKFFKKIVDKE